MQIKLTGVVRRTVEEQYDVTVEAANQEEAEDIVYAVLSDFPDSELSAVRCLCVRRDNIGDAAVMHIGADGEDYSEEDNDNDDDYA